MEIFPLINTVSIGKQQMIKRIITNIFLWLTIAIVLGAFSFYADMKLNSPHWFQKSGSIITILGAVLSARKLFSLGIKEAIENEYVIDGGNASTDWNTIKHEAKRNVVSAYLGISLIILGTIIWGYGDLVLKLFIKTN